MTYKYIDVLRKLDEVRDQNREIKKELKTVWADISCSVLIEKAQGAEYNWGFWEAIKAVMRQNNLEEVNV